MESRSREGRSSEASSRDSADAAPTKNLFLVAPALVVAPPLPLAAAKVPACGATLPPKFTKVTRGCPALNCDWGEEIVGLPPKADIVDGCEGRKPEICCDGLKSRMINCGCCGDEIDVVIRVVT